MTQAKRGEGALEVQITMSQSDTISYLMSVHDLYRLQEIKPSSFQKLEYH